MRNTPKAPKSSNAPVPLRAGPLSAVFEPSTIFLRHVMWGDKEALRAIYFAVRDPDWGTPPSRLTGLVLDERPGSFRLEIEAECVRGEIDFAWRGTIVGESSGSLRFELRGDARSSFGQARIGLCALHPIKECAGRPCWVERADGSLQYGRFPGDIEPWKPFTNFRAISFEIEERLLAEVRFEGEAFELEDQRLWTDASFKSYPKPLRESDVETIEAGTKIEQSVTLTLKGQRTATPAPPTFVKWDAVIAVADGRVADLPPIGFGASGNGRPLSASEAALLRALRPAHLRVVLYLDRDFYPEVLEAAAADAAALGSPLEAVLFVTEAESELRDLLGRLGRLRPAIARWQLFGPAGRPPDRETLRLARVVLSEYDRAAPLGVGSDQHYCQVLRGLPPVLDADFLCYPVNPQMHASDDASMVETLEAQAWTVENAKRVAWGKPVRVGPVTLIHRHRSADALGPALDGERFEAQADPRQMSLFGAAWTLGSVKRLADAAGLTYHETAGWAGVIERERGSPAVGRGWSAPATVFPMYHVFADLAEMAGGEVLSCRSSRPLVVEGLAVRRGGRTRLLLANFTPDPRRVRVKWPAGTNAIAMKTLDDGSLTSATRSPEEFRARPSESLRVSKATLGLWLRPHAIVRLDAEG